MNTVEVLCDGVAIPSKFIRDVEALADRVRRGLDAELFNNGLPPFESNITYRASAAWKDSPTHYCYIGDHSIARINYGDSDWFSPKFVLVRSLYSQLVGFSQVLWEIGGQLTFDEHGNHTVFFQGCHF